MRLEKRYVDIQRVEFADRTYVEQNVLYLSKKELKEVAMDYHFAEVDFDIAEPGTSCRLSYVSDCVQPIFKLGEGESTFPGIVDDIHRVGTGATVVLRGISVTETLLVPMVIASTLDMTGPAVEESLILPKLIHVCILAKPAEGVTNNDYFNAVNVASKKVAKYLAEAAKDVKPDEIEVFELKQEGLENLPKVAYIFQIFSHAPLTDTVFYGDGCATMLPTVVQANEILDGALIYRDYYQVSNASPTYVLQNHPVIIELMQRHGKDINFVGVIMSNTPAEVENKRRNAMHCAGLAKYQLKADCAIISKEGGGHPQIDVGLNCDACEELGIRTVLLLTEFLSAGNPIDELVLFSTENADAMVTNGCTSVMNFPRMDRVIGLPTMQNQTNTVTLDVHGPFSYAVYPVVRDALNQIGNTNLGSEVY